MGKVAFSKLGIKKENPITTFTFNDQVVEVKGYLPISEKFDLIGNVLSKSADGNRFMNPMKLKLYFTLEIIYAYTNITFTDKQKEDVTKLYDTIIGSGLYKEVRTCIPEEEYFTLFNDMMQSAQAIYAQINSAYGIIESIANDFSQTDMDASKIQEKLNNPEAIAFLKNVMDKMG